MNIVYDVTSLMQKNLTPEGIYTKHLYRLLRGLGASITPVFSPPRGVKENYISNHLGHAPKKFYGMFTPKNSILHGPSGNLLSESDKFKKVISIHDLAMFRDGYMSPGVSSQLQTHLKQQMQQDIKAIIVPSYEVHNEFLVRFPKFVNKVHVIEPGCDHILDSSNVGDGRVVDGPYFLFVGTIDKKSNVAGVIKAFDAFCSIKSGVKLVIAGDNGFGSEAIHKLLNSSKHRERFTVVGSKSDSVLKQIYSGALGLIIPSYYEGFSFPLVEAMKMGCPVVTSGLGSMKDVGGEAVHLVNPKDPEQIMGGMERIFADRVYKDKLVSAGQNLTEKMTWLKCARELINVYQKI